MRFHIGTRCGGTVATHHAGVVDAGVGLWCARVGREVVLGVDVDDARSRFVVTGEMSITQARALSAKLMTLACEAELEAGRRGRLTLC